MTQLTKIDGNNKFIVVQSNDLIEADYPVSMTARAHKVIRLVLSLISPDDKDLRTYNITIDALRQYLGLAINVKWGAFYKELKDIQDKLNRSPIEITTPEGDIIRVPFLGIKISKGGMVTFEISGLLKPFLLELKKNFTAYQLQYIPKLKSGYSIRLYELLHQYRSIGKRTFELDDLQKKVGSNYPLYGNFKVKVLQKAQKDLKKCTNLAFVFSDIKTGRKVTSIRFTIFGNTPKKDRPEQLSFLDDAFEIIDNQDTPALSEEIVKNMNRLGISEQAISKYIGLGFDVITNPVKKKHAEKRHLNLGSYYLEKLDLTENAPDRKNAAGFFIQALQNDWVRSKTLAGEKAKEAVKEKRDKALRIKMLKQKHDNLNKELEALRSPIIEQIFSDKAVFTEFYETSLSNMKIGRSSAISHGSPRDNYKNSAMLRSLMNMALEESYPSQFTIVLQMRKQIESLAKEVKALGEWI